MKSLTKIPPFIFSTSKNGDEFIIHTKEPRFIARIFWLDYHYPTESDIKSRVLTYHRNRF